MSAPTPTKEPLKWAYMMLGFLTGGKLGLSKYYCDSLLKAKKYLDAETGYMRIHMTKPLTLAWAMSDSPVGLLAWIREKLHTWTDEVYALPFHSQKELLKRHHSTPGPPTKSSSGG